MVTTLADFGVVGRAIGNDLMTIKTWNPREYTTDKHRTVDDRPFGGGPGMVMMVEPLRQTIKAAKQAAAANTPVIYMSPQGKTLNQQMIGELAQQEELIFIAGRYEGIDERIIELDIDAEYSIGDYVLSGGELPVMVTIDAITRQLPGALGHEESAKQDSFMQGLLDCPHYTRPQVIDGLKVPDVLLSGDHKAINRWRQKQALGRTKQRRPDLLDRLELSSEQQALLNEYLAEPENKQGQN